MAGASLQGAYSRAARSQSDVRLVHERDAGEGDCPKDSCNNNQLQLEGLPDVGQRPRCGQASVFCTFQSHLGDTFAVICDTPQARQSLLREERFSDLRTPENSQV